MKRDIVLSGMVAVAFHAFILSGPLPTGGVPYADVYKPVSLSIIHPKSAVTASFQEEVSPFTKPEPPAPPAPKPVSKQAPIPEKKEVHKKPVDVKPPVKERMVTVKRLQEVTETTVLTPELAEPFPANNLEPIGEGDVNEGPHGAGGEGKEESALETASIQKDGSHGGLWKEGVAPGEGSPEGIIGNAIPTYKEKPSYPSLAIRRGYEGKVVLEVEVLATGKVGQINITKSSGFKVLDRAAVKSVKTWRFAPGTKKWAIVPIIFDLKDV